MVSARVRVWLSTDVNRLTASKLSINPKEARRKGQQHVLRAKIG
jgi:hypothetical protein